MVSGGRARSSAETTHLLPRRCNPRPKRRFCQQSPASTARSQVGEKRRAHSFPSGLPKCDITMTLAPRSKSASIVGASRSISGRIGHAPVLDRDIQIRTQQHPFAAHVDGVEGSKFLASGLRSVTGTASAGSVLTPNDRNMRQPRACGWRIPTRCHTRRGRGRTVCRGPGSGSHRKRRCEGHG